jgi:hypothetical protein
MGAVNAHGERHVPAENALGSAVLGGGDVADIVRARHQIEVGRFAEYQAQCHERLRCGAVVVVAFTRVLNGSGRAVAHTAEDRALERHRI